MLLKNDLHVHTNYSDDISDVFVTWNPILRHLLLDLTLIIVRYLLARLTQKKALTDNSGERKIRLP